MEIITSSDNVLNTSTLMEAKPLQVASRVINLKIQMDSMQSTIASNNESNSFSKYDHHVDNTNSPKSHTNFLDGCGSS